MTSMTAEVNEDWRPTSGAAESAVRAPVGRWKQASGDARLFSEAQVFYVDSLGVGAPQLRAPLKLELTMTEDGLLEVFSPALSVGGVGESLTDAMADLSGTALGLWDEFRLTPEAGLDAGARAQLAVMRKLFAAT